MGTFQRQRLSKRITVLAGGVGAARFLRGLSSHIEPGSLTVVVNTGDDDSFFGLHVSPDVDTILYTLAGLADRQQGWGRQNDSFVCLDGLSHLYPETWFRLGDKDLATHIYRTDRLRRGATLSRVTSELAQRFGVAARVLPMTDGTVRTFVTVEGKGALPFQQYLVRDHGSGSVERIVARGARRASPTPGVLAAIRNAEVVIIPPSNPFVSIGPIMALRGVREAMRCTSAPIVAISPLIAGHPVKGPLHRMLAGLGHEVSSFGVARLYRGVANIFVLDEQDRHLTSRITELGMRTITTDTLMSSPMKSRRLAQTILKALT